MNECSVYYMTLHEVLNWCAMWKLHIATYAISQCGKHIAIGVWSADQYTECIVQFYNNA